MIEEKYFENISNIKAVNNDNIKVIKKDVLRKRFNFLGEYLYWAIYFVTPLVIPPVAIVIIIVVKLFSWPRSAIPDGPINKATNFTLTNPVNILTKVEVVVSEKTLRKSSLELLKMPIINFFKLSD